MNRNLLFPLDPLDELHQPPQRIDIQREHLRHQRQFYQDLSRDLAQQIDRQQSFRARIWRPLLSARHALGRALVAVGRQMTTDTPGGSGGASTSIPHGLRATQNHS